MIENDVVQIKIGGTLDLEDAEVILNGVSLKNVVRLELNANVDDWKPELTLVLRCPDIDVRVPAVITTMLVASDAEEVAKFMGMAAEKGEGDD